MSNLKLAGALTAGAICLVLVQFISWGGIETEGGEVFGFSFPGAEIDSYTWHIDANGETEGWYSNDFDDSDGIGQIRTAVPFLLTGLVVGTIGAILAFGRTTAGPILILVGALVSLTGLVLFATGTQALYDGEHEWAAAFFLAIAGTALTLVGGVLGLMAGNTSAARASF